MSKPRKTKLKITQDDFELEVWKTENPGASISLGIADQPNKRCEIAMSLSNEQIDLLIDVLNDLRFE